MVRSRSAMSCLLVRRVWLASGRCLQRRPDALTILLWAPSFFQDCVASQFSCVHDFSETPKAPNCGATNSVRAPDIAFNASSGKAQVAAHVASEWQLGAVVIEVAG